jgi:hypothetical protein
MGYVAGTFRRNGGRLVELGLTKLRAGPLLPARDHIEADQSKLVAGQPRPRRGRGGDGERFLDTGAVGEGLDALEEARKVAGFLKPAEGIPKFADVSADPRLAQEADGGEIGVVVSGRSSSGKRCS